MMHTYTSKVMTSLLLCNLYSPKRLLTATEPNTSTRKHTTQTHLAAHKQVLKVLNIILPHPHPSLAGENCPTYSVSAL